MSQHIESFTVQLDADLAAALALKAEQVHRTVSEMVNHAVRISLEEDQSDLAAFDERAAESTMTHEELLQDLKAHGKV